MATMPTAIPMASRNPIRKTAPRMASRTRVSPIGWWKRPCTKGFSRMWAVASAADRVMVMMKSVKAKPSRTSTNALPHQRGRCCSSIRMLPCPCGLCAATWA